MVFFVFAKKFKLAYDVQSDETFEDIENQLKDCLLEKYNK